MEEQVVAITTVPPMAKAWIAYTLHEGEHMRMLGYDSEEEADEVVDLFKRTGKMNNTYRFLVGRDAPEYLEPNMVMKLLASTEMHYNLAK